MALRGAIASVGHDRIIPFKIGKTGTTAGDPFVASDTLPSAVMTDEQFVDIFSAILHPCASKQAPLFLLHARYCRSRLITTVVSDGKYLAVVSDRGNARGLGNFSRCIL